MALTKPEFLKRWTSAAAGAVMGATAILSPFSAAQAGDRTQVASASTEASISEQLQEVHIQDRRKAEDAAEAYSLSKRAIGIVVLGSTINGDTGGRWEAPEIGEWIKENFAKFGVEAEYYTAMEETDGFAVMFLVRGESYGYYGGAHLNDGFKLAKSHLPMAWKDDLAESSVNAISQDPS